MTFVKAKHLDHFYKASLAGEGLFILQRGVSACTLGHLQNSFSCVGDGLGCKMADHVSVNCYT